MLEPNFTKYSLALIKDGNIIYSSKESGLKPLVECIKKYKSKFKNCILHDKVVGLAAAMLIVYSNMISSVFTKICSKSAKELLERNNIKLKAENIGDNILTKNGSVCTMELKARVIDDNKKFFLEMKKMF